MKSHEQTKTHIHNLNSSDNLKLTYKQQHEQNQKQKQEQEQGEKEQERKQHEQTVADLNETFPTYPSENQPTNNTKNSMNQPLPYLIQSPLNARTLQTPEHPKQQQQQTSKVRNKDWQQTQNPNRRTYNPPPPSRPLFYIFSPPNQG